MAMLTSRAQRVMQLATEESRRLGHATIAPEHILLGLCKEGTGTGAGVLAQFCDGDLSRIVQQVEQFTEVASKTATNDELPFSVETPTVLARAMEESQRLSHNWIGTEHLLLGLSRCPEGVVANVFQKLGTSQDEVREEPSQYSEKRPPRSPRDTWRNRYDMRSAFVAKC